MRIFKRSIFLLLVFLLVKNNIIIAAYVPPPLTDELIALLKGVRYDDATYKKQIEIFINYAQRCIEIYEKYAGEKYSEYADAIYDELVKAADDTGMNSLTEKGNFSSEPIITKDEFGNYNYNWGIFATGGLANGIIDGRLFEDCIRHENDHKQQFHDEGLEQLFIDRQIAKDNKNWVEYNNLHNKIKDIIDKLLINDEINNHNKDKEALEKMKKLLSAGDGSDGGMTGTAGKDRPRHADESFAVNYSVFPEIFYYRQIPDAGILMNFDYFSLTKLMGGINKSLILSDLNTSSQELISSSSVLIIPSGGLSGLDSSRMFRELLANYVSIGGVLICLTQQHGYEFSALPGGQVGGYGWQEDQGCFDAAVYIDNWHQVLSGQSTDIITALVDGYFTSYPDSTTVLLRRTKNNEPAMIMYPYGKGYVIATTMFEDWAFGHGQSTAQGRALIRDIVSWAKDAKELSEIKPGESIDLSFGAKNKTEDKNATQLKLSILDSNRNVVSESIQAVTLSSGQSTNILTTYNSQFTTSLGIWSMEYSLFDSTGLEFQKESQGERFVISKPPKNTQDNPNFLVWATSTTEQVTPGSSLILTMWVRNNSDIDLSNGSIIVDAWRTPRYIISGVDVGAHSEASFTYTTSIGRSTLFEIILFDSQNIRLSSAEKGIWVITPSIRANIFLDKTTYKKGETVNISGAIINLTSAAYNAEIKTYILNPLNQKVFDTAENVNLTGSAQVLLNKQWTIDNLLYGTYIACIDVYKDGQKIGGNSIAFINPGPLARITQNLPPVWDLENNLSFNLNNIGGVDIETASLKVEVKNPNTNVVYSETKTVTGLLSGANQTVDYNISLPEILYGNYSVKYVMSFENKIVSGTEVICSQAVFKTTFDKVKYNIFDEVQLKADLSNTGKFKEDGVISLVIPGFGFNQQNSISLLPFESKAINYSIPIPNNVTAGIYTGKISFNLALGSKIEKNLEIIIPDYNLEVTMPEGNYSAGDNLSVKIKNTGGIPFYGQSKIYFRDSDAYDVYNTTEIIDPLQPGSEILINVPVPSEAITGNYTMYMDCRDTKINKVILQNSSNIAIEGVIVQLAVSTNKETYFNYEPVNANFKFDLTSGNLNQAKLTYEIFAEQGAVQHYPSIGLSDIISIAPDKDGSLWFGMNGNGAVCYQNESTWVHYTIKQGLSNNSVQAILIDNSGNRWFGTHNGLSKFNGLTFMTYTVKDGLAGNDITSLFQDKNGNIWVGTYSTGISKYSDGIWTSYSMVNGLISNSITHIGEGKDGFIWIATQDGVSSFNGFVFTNYDTTNGLVSKNISCLYGDKGGSLWFGTWGSGVSKFDGTKWQNLNVMSGLSNLFIRDIAEDSEGNIWVGTERGLNKVASQTSQVTNYFKTNGLISDKIRSACFDNIGNLWIGTDLGVNKFNGQNWISYDVIPDQSGPMGNHVYCLFEEDNSTMWLGTESGLSKYDSLGNWTNWTEKNGLNNNHISSIAKDGGSLWIGTMGGGIMKTVSLTADTANVQIYNRSNSGLLSNYITSIGVAPDGTKWFGTWLGGVTNYNGTQWTTYTKTNGVAGENVWSIAFETNGVSWFGTEGGLSRFDLTTWKNYTIDDGLPVNKVTALAVDSSNVKWIGTWGGGLVKFDDSTFVTYTKANGLADNYINQVNIDNEGKIWVATKNGGISVFNNATWQTVDENVGLPENFVFCISNVSRKRWVGSFSGLFSGININGAQPAEEINVDIASSYDLGKVLNACPVSGKMQLRGRLNSKAGQLAYKDKTYFYVLSEEQKLYLSLNTDKEIYKPDETVIISGKVTNLKDYDLPEVTLVIKKGENNEVVYSNVLPLNAFGSYSFSFNLAAKLPGFTLEASTAAPLDVIINTKIDVAEPEIKAELTAPDYIGRKPFNVSLKLENEGKIDANIVCSFMGENQNIPIAAGKTILLNKKLSTDKDINITADISGDLTLNLFKKVVFGEKTETHLTAQIEYSEGQVEIPYIVTNNGEIDSELNTEFSLYQNLQLIIQNSILHYLPKGQNISNSLQYNLTKGEYKLAYSNCFDSGEIMFSVKKYNDLEINPNINSNNSYGKIDVAVDVSNSGINDFNGVLLIESLFSRNEQDVVINKGSSNKYDFFLTPANILPGQTDINVSLLYAGNVLLKKVVKADIYAPTFEFASVPQYPTYHLGEIENMSFIIKNTGNLAGEVEVKLKVIDILDNSKKVFLSPGEEKTLSFDFTIPDDLEAKDYKATVQMGKNDILDISFKVEGVKINVTASFDKEYYKVGDVAVLTLNLINESDSFSPQMYGRVNYHSFDSSQNFVLVNNETLQFEIPVDEFNGEKVFYGIYMSSGRSIWLNTIYLYQEKDIINLATDKQVYKPGEAVTVNTNSIYSGILSYSFPGGEGQIPINGTAGFTLQLPPAMVAGTYSINYKFTYDSSVNEGSFPFDVDGIQVKVFDCNLDKGKYNTQDTIKSILTLDVNQDLMGYLESYIYNPEGKVIPYTGNNLALSVGENKISLQGDFNTNVAGMHNLIYSIYQKDNGLLLEKGSKAFDVGNMTLADFSVDKTSYLTGFETVYVNANFYSQGENAGNFKLSIGSNVLINQPVTLNGFYNTVFAIIPANTGSMRLTGELTAGGLISRKETGFDYGSDLPDLVIDSIKFTMPQNFGSNEAVILVNVKNIGKTDAGSGFIVALYNGNPDSTGVHIGDIGFNSIASNSNSEGVYNLNVSGTNNLEIYAIVDNGNDVREFFEDNNKANISVTIPNPPVFDPIPELSNNSAINLTGSGPVNNVIEIYQNGQIITSVTADSTRVFSANITAVEGENNIYGRSRDNNGDVSLFSNMVQFTLDTMPPAIPVLIYPEDSSVVYSKIVTITGTSEPLSLVSLTISGNTHTANAMSTGQYTFADMSLTEGENIIRLWVTDLAGNNSHVLQAKVIVKLVDLEVTKTIPINYPRLLVWVEDDNTEQFIQQIMQGSSIYYNIVKGNEDLFNEKFRSGKYNLVFLLNGEMVRLKRELKERVFAGEGVIVSSEKTTKSPEMADILGIKFIGYLPQQDNLINLLNSPISQSSTLQSKGKSQRVELTTGQKAGYIQTAPQGSHNGKISSISVETGYDFSEDTTWIVTLQIYAGDTTLTGQLLDYETVQFNNLPVGSVDSHTGYNSTNLEINGIDNRIEFVIRNMAQNGYLSGQYTLRAIISKNGVETILGPSSFNVNKCLTPVSGAVYGSFKIISVDKEGICCVGTQEPAIILNNYGEGKTVAFTFDLVSSNNDTTFSKIKELIINSINYTTPETNPIYPMASLPIGIDIQNKGKAIDLSVREMVPADLLISDIFSAEGGSASGGNAGVKQNNEIIWQFNMPENTVKGLKYYLSIPDNTSQYTLVTEVNYLDSAAADGYDSTSAQADKWKFYNNYPVGIANTHTMDGLIQEIIDELNGMSLGSQDRDKANVAIAKIQAIRSRNVTAKKDLEKNIEDTLKAVDKLAEISVNTTSVRLKVDELLKINEVKWTKFGQ